MRKLYFGLIAFLGSAVLTVIVVSGLWLLKDRFSEPPPLHDDKGLYRTSEVPGLPHEHVPNSSGVIAGIEIKLNSLGFRGQEISLEKPEGIIRIAVLGDSEVFGQGVRDNETLPALLEGLLNKGLSSRGYEFINAGVRGYSTAHEAVLLRKYVIPVNPDGVILCITEANDPEVEPFRYESPELEKARESFWWKVAPVRLMMAWRMQGEYIEAARDHIRSYYKQDGEPWKNFVRSLEDIKKQCDESGAWLFAITLPLLEDEDTFKDERRQLHEKLTELGIEFIDPKPALSRHSWQELVVSPKDFHPNALALRIYADLIYEKLKELGHASL